MFINKTKHKYFFLFFFIVNIFLLFSKESKDDDWIIAVSEFEANNLDAAHKMYQTIVPQMFLIYLDAGGKRLVPFEEKKIRSLVATSEKKIKLINERAKLIQQKDELFLSIEDSSTKSKKQKELENKISQKDEEIFQAGIDITIEENKFFSSEEPKNLKLWKSGKDLLKLQKDQNLLQQLKKENISAVVYGSVKDVSGYMVINVKLDTGLPNLPAYEFYDAGPYDSVEKIVQNLSRRIYSVIQNTKEVKVFFDVKPKSAKLYIDNKKIDDFSKPVILYEGTYQVSASAENYLEASKKIKLQDMQAYKLKINLKKIETIEIGFDLKNQNPTLFYKTQYAAIVPGIISVPKTKSILEFTKNGVNTFGLVNGSKLNSPAHIQNMIVKLNKKSVKESIELHRKILYWSLGALYISLPFTMIFKAKLEDNVRSLQSGKILKTQEAIDKVKKYNIAYSTFQGISIALGVNYFIQLIVYLVKADRALPRKVLTDKKQPVYTKKNEKPAENKKDSKTNGNGSDSKDNTKIDKDKNNKKGETDG